MKNGIVAIVGRPNVGKSTFFNKICGKRVSIVDDIPGVTRDRVTCETEWNGTVLTVIDTGGIEPKTDNMMFRHMKDQAEMAVAVADVIIFIVDLHSGITANDSDISALLKKSGKPVLVAVNKVDTTGETPPEFYEFYGLGFEEVFPVSSIHGTGAGDILDRVVDLIPEEGRPQPDEGRISVAIIGRPNAGKSSVVNCVLREERMIVSDIPGTTRDAVDSDFENRYGKYRLIDTAGIRRNAKIEDRIEKYSVIRAKAAIERADVCLLIVDATQGVTAQDERIAGLGHEAGKPTVIAINKWDLVEKDNSTVNKFTKEVYAALAYMDYAPLVFVSAKTGLRIDRLFTMINDVYESSRKRVTTGVLNDVLNDAISRTQPPSDKGRQLKLYYMTQTGIQPPTFVVFCNQAELFHFSYQRYIENCIRKAFGFEGTPIRLVIKQRGEEFPR
ncbi:MAG: ribosome biogenesis GTPase Der [Clostridiales bacterium]|nr:ribosome biogenesis GTPase Der [Clostridiales bacterium]